MFRSGFTATPSSPSKHPPILFGGSDFSDQMIRVSSRLSILTTGGPFSPSHLWPSTLIRLTYHHSLTSSLPPIAAVPRHLLNLSRSNSRFLFKSSQQFSSQFTSDNLEENSHVPADAHLVTPSHPWPEWSELLESISVAGYLDGNKNIKDEFVPNESLSMEFVDAACRCLGFAHDKPHLLGWLPKDHIQVLVSNGGPFLFKNAIETEKRMRSFLQEAESGEATTVDLMKYILSYASNPIFYPERNIKEDIESSARNLLRDMVNLNGSVEALSTPAMEKVNGIEEDEQKPRNVEPNITMNRGDWICRKCSFMNSAKNTKCLECKELRPQRQLTGNEWDCPKCNFFNHGRNMVCLKCECRRPGEVSLPVGQVKTPGNPNGKNSNYTPFVPLPADMFAKKSENTTIDRNSEPKLTVSSKNSEKSVTEVENKGKDNAEEEKSERWFKKVAELHDVTDLASAISDDDFPDIMPMRKGESRFVVSKKKDRSLTSSTYKRQQAVEQGNSSSFVPFVPFPPDYFAKKDDNQQSKSTDSHVNSAQGTNGTSNVSATKPETSYENSSKDTNDNNFVQETRHQLDSQSTRPETSKGDGLTPKNQNMGNGYEGLSLEGSAVKETDPLDMSEEAKAERWFRRVAQIKDISELSQIPDEDFPSIMPMRKGVNRFVVSKRKTPLERRLTSSQYRKNLRTVTSDPTKKEGDGS